MLTEVVEALRGEAVSPVKPYSVADVSTDSRTVGPGAIFFALRGEHFDGHDYVGAALEKHAVAAVVARAELRRLHAELRGRLSAEQNLIGVDDPAASLGALAHYHRRQVPAEVIAVVGSNGKTTTKTMVDHVLRGRLQGRAAEKSFNNAIGVPLTLLSVRGADEYVVVEIGTNNPGEVAALAALAEPEIAIITSIAEEHLAGLHDLAGVAAEECSILQYVRDRGFAAVNLDAPLVRDYLSAAGVTIATYGRATDADLRLSRVRYEHPWLHFTVNDRFDYRLPMPGAHNAYNAAAAIAVARRLGFAHDEIAARLETIQPPPLRCEVREVGGVRVLNDAYNANPGSAFAAIDMFEQLPCAGRRYVVFGEMRELGRHAAQQHERVAARLAQSRFERVYLVGRAAEYMTAALRGPTLFSAAVAPCENVDDCRAQLGAALRPGDAVLLKGSRAVGLERILDGLRIAPETATPIA